MAVVATGFFDGVHLGHQKVIETLLDCAARRAEQSLVITFWPHPRTILQDEARSLRLLSSSQEKNSLLYSLGVDRVEVLPFDLGFASMTSRQYLEMLISRYSATALVVGYDTRVGCDQAGPDEIGQLASELNLECIRCQAEGEISSTRIRAALQQCDPQAASAMLGRNYTLKGVVVSGMHLGRTIGFPTANLRFYDPLKMIPGAAVYFSRATVLGTTYDAMTNIDPNGKVECYLIGLDHDIYGLDVDLEFVGLLRHEMRFDNIGQLKVQLEKDLEQCLNIARQRN